MNEPSIDQPTPLDASETVQDWHALPANAAQVAMIIGALWGLLSGLGAAAITGRAAWSSLSLAWALLLPIAVVLAVVIAGTWLGYRRWKFSLWKLDATGLQVKRGRLWRKEILIPRTRVQHLDIERGPIERHFGLATLVVHTAGTRIHALRQSGLNDADAIALRDALVPASDQHDDVL